MSEAADVAKHTPEWLEDLADRLQQSDMLGADGIAYALEWGAWDIRVLESRLSSVIDVSQSTIIGLKVELGKLDGELIRLRKLARDDGAWT